MILLILILVYLLFSNLKEKFIINDEKWLNYRLGDILNGYLYKTDINLLKKTKKKLPNSIGVIYLNRTEYLDKRFNNFPIINDIINEKVKSENIKLPSENDLVIHLRIGDSIINTNNNKTNNNNFIFKKLKKNTNSYGTDINKLELLVDKIIKTKEIDNIYLVYGSHKKNININSNNLYLEEVKNILTKFKKNIILKNNTPDDDFIFMSKSKLFIKSGGGFSFIISKVVELNDGKVYSTDI